MPQSSYSQSLDSLPIKELNNEFLKGIEAREKLHILKQIRHDDSMQLAFYKNILIPEYRRAVDSTKREYSKLYDRNSKNESKIESQKKTIKYLKISTFALFLLFLGSILPN